MIDLAEARALAAAARADMAHGLTARLADVVEALCDALDRSEEDVAIWRNAAHAEAQGGKARADMLTRAEGVLAQLRDLAANPGTHRPNFPHDMAFAASMLAKALNDD